MEALDPSTVAERIAELRREHRALDERIQQLAANPDDELESKRLKKRKLQLKDCIAKLESLLIPDQPA
nr:YdcH family protein [Pseudoxanthomonas jiangsuensis]